MMNAKTGLALAATAAALFATTVVTTAPAYAGDMGVKCSGINSCKGTSECKTANNACKGQNECKGQGWVMSESKKACTDAGGKVVK